MKNPWTAKNPFMSMWLSAANTAIGSARGLASAAVQREVNRATHTAYNQAVEDWTRLLTAPWAAATTGTPQRHRSHRAHRSHR